jgi:biopolymer transport protein ExbD
MKKPTKKRISIKMDMTPMVDVAFLLLTFFMLTTQFKAPEDVQITLPSSHSAFKLPESDVMMVTVTKDGKIRLGVDAAGLRVRLFGEAARNAASVEVDQKQLTDLLIQARIMNPKLRTVIKGDKDAPYGPIEDVMNILQKTRITRFNLITDLERS